MYMRLLAIGNKMPEWVNEGFQEYSKRFIAPFSLELIEIPAEKRLQTSNIDTVTQREGEKLLKTVKSNHRIIALDVKGAMWSTETLASKLKEWQRDNRGLDLIVGGPDGLSQDVLKKSELRWSLSPLTLPHPLVRIVLAEQLYRAQTILQGHPYHRA